MIRSIYWRDTNDYETSEKETIEYGAGVTACSFLGLFDREALAQGYRFHRFQTTNVCELTAKELAKACRFEVQDSAKVATANCLNLLVPEAAAECKLAVCARPIFKY